MRLYGSTHHGDNQRPPDGKKLNVRLRGGGEIDPEEMSNYVERGGSNLRKGPVGEYVHVSECVLCDMQSDYSKVGSDRLRGLVLDGKICHAACGTPITTRWILRYWGC